MLKPLIVKHETDEGFRRALARTAADEIHEIVEVLDLTAGDISADFWRGVSLRLKSLAEAAMWAGDDKMATTEELADIVYGERGWVDSDTTLQPADA